jgi:hypothetical protein
LGFTDNAHEPTDCSPESFSNYQPGEALEKLSSLIWTIIIAGLLLEPNQTCARESPRETIQIRTTEDPKNFSNYQPGEALAKISPLFWTIIKLLDHDLNRTKLCLREPARDQFNSARPKIPKVSQTINSAKPLKNLPF